MTDPMLDAALEYAAHGWPVFPLRGKLPARPKDQGGNGFKDATTDPDTVQRMWTTYPRANIGIRTGMKSGLAVLDIDPDHGGTVSLAKIEDERGTLPGTVMQMTGSGGLHMLYKWRAGISIGTAIWGAGLDLRGEGGYIVAAPSIHPTTRRPYEWQNDWQAPLPDWPAQLPMPIKASPQPRTYTPRREDAGSIIAGLVQTVIDAPVGQRNNVLNWAAYRAGQHVLRGRFTLEQAVGALADAARVAGLDEYEIIATIGSGMRAAGTPHAGAAT